MLTTEDYKVIFVTIGLAGILLLASPTLALVMQLPKGEKYSELWLLGPGMKAQDYPFNVNANETYSVWLGVANHLGSSVSYYLYVKFRNENEIPPNATAGTPSPSQLLYKQRVYVQDGKNWTDPLDFSFSEISFSQDQSIIHSVTLNGVGFNVNKTASWDSENKGYYYQLLIELWMYEVTSNQAEFNNRFVSLWLNATL